VFFADGDRQRYLSLLSAYGRRYELDIWAYCLMSNHVHFVAVPRAAESLGLACRDTHQAYASWLNRRQGETGHVWQGRFYSTPLDDPHLWAAVRYVERNPVRAGLVERAEDWAWSSAAGHCGLRADPLLSKIRMPWPVPDWRAYLRDESAEEIKAIRMQTRTGRPCGSAGFVEHLESLLGRVLRPRKRGRKPKRKRQKQE